MNIRAALLVLTGVFFAFVMEHLPMPPLLYWLQPRWVLLVVTLLVLNAPRYFGLWLSIPLGLMLDVEHTSILGTHVVSMSVYILLLQILHRRMALFNLLQQTGVIFLLVAANQLLIFWAVAVISENSEPLKLWEPALTSALLWPWMFGLTHIITTRLRLI